MKDCKNFIGLFFIPKPHYSISSKVINMQQKLYTCCFSGHRILPSAHVEPLFSHLVLCLKELIAKGFYSFATGGACGFDTMAAETILTLKAEFPQIRLIVVAPFADQAANRPYSDILQYERIREACDEYICLSSAYAPGCMRRRNQYLVDMSSLCVCYLTSNRSGTSQTVAYANRQGVEVINLAPSLMPPDYQ